MWRQGAVIYVIEGDPNILTGLSEFLSRQKFDFQLFDSPNGFLKGFDPLLPGAVIADINMHGMTLPELSAAILGCGAVLPLMPMASMKDLSKAVEVFKAGIFDFVEKPINTTELMQCLYLAFQASRKSQPTLQLLTRLTKRERQVFDFLVMGYTNKVIAQRLNVIDKTVEAHRSAIMRKLEAGSLAALIEISYKVKQQ